MFTGIIEAIGTIRQIAQNSKGVSLQIDSGKLDLCDVKIGDSIAVNGICLTVTVRAEHSFSVDVSHETLRCATGLSNLGNQVNLEKAMRLSDRLGGHLVSGHVDSVGEVIQFEPEGENYQLSVQVPAELLKYIVVKGSVTVNGVSLTVNRIEGKIFDVNLIPHTLAETNLKLLKVGEAVNLETDLLARYVERLMIQSINQS
ncbi:MAG: riboflavin synthase [Nitrosomonas sp.]|nr:riboflavin synthase [Nitrosomonas sp.]